MNWITISSLFRRLDIRITEGVLKKVKEEGNFKFSYVMASNGKMAEAIFLEENKEVKTIKEFFEFYQTRGMLTGKTKFLIENNMVKIDNDFVFKNIIKENLQIELNVKVGDDMANALEKYKYKSNSYSSIYVSQVVADIKINNRSPYVKDRFIDVPIGTRYSWFKEKNDIRILYDFFAELQNIEMLKNYSREDTLKFLYDIKTKVQELAESEIKEDIKMTYLKNIEIFLYEYEQKNKIKENRVEDSKEIIALNFILKSNTMWKAFFEENIENIEKIIRQDKELAKKIMIAIETSKNM